MADPTDEEVAAYRERLKSSRVRFGVSRSAIISLAALFLGGILAGVMKVVADANEPESALGADTTGSAAPRASTEAEVAQRELQSVADDWASLDPGGLPEGRVSEATGRRVVFIETAMEMDPAMARLLGSQPKTQRKLVLLPDDFTTTKPGAFALRPSEAGVVVLVRTKMSKSGTYSGGGDAIDLDYEGTAIIVPERRKVATVHCHVSAPATATRTNGVLLGGFAHDDRRWLEAAATALSLGEAPPL